MIGIYKITSPTERIYIGQSINIKKRFNSYLKLTNCKTQIKLYNSFKKHGVENHNFEVLCECEISELNNKERYYQDLFNVIEKGLNCLLTKSSDRSGKMSEETILRKSIAVSGVNHPNFGKKLSIVTRDRIRKGNLKKVISNDVRLKISQTMIEKGLKPKDKMFGFANHKSIKVKSFNIITKEIIILNLSQTAKLFKVDRELISNRLNSVTKRYRKLKEWNFEYV